MHARICHIFAPEEFAERLSGAPENDFIIIDPIKLKGLQDALPAVVSIDVALADNRAKLVRRIDRALVHVGFDGTPVSLVNQLGEIDFRIMAGMTWLFSRWKLSFGPYRFVGMTAI